MILFSHSCKSLMFLWSVQRLLYCPVIIRYRSPDCISHILLNTLSSLFWVLSLWELWICCRQSHAHFECIISRAVITYGIWDPMYIIMQWKGTFSGLIGFLCMGLPLEVYDVYDAKLRRIMIILLIFIPYISFVGHFIIFVSLLLC